VEKFNEKRGLGWKMRENLEELKGKNSSADKICTEWTEGLGITDTEHITPYSCGHKNVTEVQNMARWNNTESKTTHQHILRLNISAKCTMRGRLWGADV